MAKASNTPNREILEAALQGLESQRERLDQQIAQVRALLGTRVGRPPKSAVSHSGAAGLEHRRTAPARRRELSPEARKRIAAAQKKRWAAFRKGKA